MQAKIEGFAKSTAAARWRWVTGRTSTRPGSWARKTTMYYITEREFVKQNHKVIVRLVNVLCAPSRWLNLRVFRVSDEGEGVDP